jgi:hypothetical protein
MVVAFPYSTIRKFLPDDSTIPGTQVKTNMPVLTRLTVAGDPLSDITVCKNYVVMRGREVYKQLPRDCGGGKF